MSRRKQAKPQHFQSDPEVASLPRRDGECSGPRRGHTDTHSRTLGPTHTRRAPRPPPLSPSVLGASDFISCFLDFNLPGQASPCPGRASLSRLELSGVPSPRLGGVGSTGQLSPPPSGSEEPRPRPCRPEGRSQGQRPSVAAHAWSLPLPRAPPGSPGWASVAWASPPSPAANVKEVYFVRVAERRARGELAVPLPAPTLSFPLD